MHGHGLFNNVDQQLVDSMMKHFEWVHTAQVKTSIARQFTVSVSVKASFYEHNEDERRQLFQALIEHTLRFISWSPEKTLIYI